MARIGGFACIGLCCAGLAVRNSIKSALVVHDPMGIIIKIFMSGVQLNAVASTIQFKVSPAAEQTLQVSQDASSVGSTLVNVDCFVDDSFTGSTFYAQSVFYLGVPLSMPLLGFCFVSLYALYQRRKRKRSMPWEQMTDLIIACTIFLLFMLQPTLAKAGFNVFNCMRLGQEAGQFFVRKDHTMQCWRGAHVELVLTVGVPLFVFWVIGVRLRAHMQHLELIARSRLHFACNASRAVSEYLSLRVTPAPPSAFTLCPNVQPMRRSPPWACCC